MRVGDLRWSTIGRQYRLELRDDRRVTRLGLRSGLIAIRRHVLRNEPLWFQLWAANTWAAHEAFYTWHIRIPTRYSDHDRARVAWLLRGGATTPSQRKALAWSKRRS